MASLNGPFDFTGKIGKFSAYKRKGSDKIILRMGKGPTKKQIRDQPQFERTRQNNEEFKACTMFTALIRDVAYPLNHLGDPNFTGALNKLAKLIQQEDDAGERGERGIYLSRFGHMVRGFNLNKNYPFDSVLRHPLQIQKNRETASASITIPRLMPGINLIFPEHWHAPFYRFIFSLAPANDVVYNERRFECRDAGRVHFHLGEWEHAQASVQERTVNMQLEQEVHASMSIVLSVGIEMGMPDRFGEMEPLRMGTAKILEVF